LLLSRGDALVFFERPISAGFMGICVVLLVAQLFFAWRATRSRRQAKSSDDLRSIEGAGAE
ncbi:hypothetical protein, partial [Listeria monocytogenes]